MRTALIGYSGFVGSNLAAAHAFTESYNTANVEQLRGRSFDVVVTAASRADSHRINTDGAADLAEIDAYLELLSTVSTERLVLVSTVCVYPGGTTPDETTPLSSEGLTPYGANRLHMEQVLGSRFATLPVRLPQLYGLNVRKGIVHDLLNDHRVEYIRPDGVFQYYDLRRLWSDITVALDAGLDALNVATPPLRSDRVAAECFGRDIADQVVPGEESPFAQMYTRDMRTVHDALYGGAGGYLHDETTELAAIASFVRGAGSSSTARSAG